MPSTEDVADRVRYALDSGDLEAMSDLLHPNAKWGAPDDENPDCQNRNQVLGWYREAKARGVRARVTEVEASGDKILVGLKVATSAGNEPGVEADRWQVLTVVDGRIADIRGFDDRSDAVLRVEADS